VGGEEDPWEWGSVRNGALWRYCGTTERFGTKGRVTVFKFIHYLVHHRKGFHSVKITFPIRGHSYMECDKNFGLVNLKTKMETPSEWYSLLKT
jgi:hypothetical protein